MHNPSSLFGEELDEYLLKFRKGNSFQYAGYIFRLIVSIVPGGCVHPGKNDIHRWVVQKVCGNIFLSIVINGDENIGIPFLYQGSGGNAGLLFEFFRGMPLGVHVVPSDGIGALFQNSHEPLIDVSYPGEVQCIAVQDKHPWFAQVNHDQKNQ